MLILFQYLRLVHGSGFLFDDWGSILTASAGYIQGIQNWCSIWLIRPLSLIVLPGIITLFGSNPAAYFILNSSIIFFSTRLIAYSLNRYLASENRWLFYLLVFAPTIASTSIFSPVNQLEMSLSFLFISIYTWQSSRIVKSRIISRISEFLLVTIGILFYEVTLPLVVISLFLAFLRSKKEFLFSLIPLMSALICVTFWQKIIVPSVLSTDLSRINSINLLSGATYLYQLVIGVPIKLLTGIYYSETTLISFLSILILLSVFLFRSRGELYFSQEKKKLWVFNVFIGIGFSVAFSLFLFSGLAGDTSSYSNRLFFSTWVLISLVIAVNVSFSRSKILMAVALVLLAANLANFTQTTGEAIRATESREEILNSVSAYMGDQNLSASQYLSIFVDIPCTLAPSLSKTVVFCANWDLDSALRLNGYKGPPVYITSSSAKFDAATGRLTMGDAYIQNGPTLLLVGGHRNNFQEKTFSNPRALFESEINLFVRNDLEIKEGSKLSCLNSVRNPKNWLLLDIANLKANLSCLADPFPLHI